MYSYVCFLITVPSGAATNITVEVLSSTSLLITWEPPPPSEHNGVITLYRVLVTSDSGQIRVYNVSADPLSLRIEGNVMVMHVRHLISLLLLLSLLFSLTGLEKYSQYGIQVAAVSSYGVGPSSASVSVRTNEDCKASLLLQQCIQVFS